MADIIQEQTLSPAPTAPPETPSISVEDYMEYYAAHFYEWAAGELIPMSPTSMRHQLICAYLYDVLRVYFRLMPHGRVITAPFVMQLDALNVRREPDVLVALEGSASKLTETALIGPADICIEIVSPESMARDHGVKLEEYEKAGVREYWIIDPLRSEARFLRLSDDGLYRSQALDANGQYITPLLPGFELPVATLWQNDLPGIVEVVDSVRARLAQQ